MTSGGSVTVFADHANQAEATHAITCRNADCPKFDVPVIAPPLPGHHSRGKKSPREIVYCGSCQMEISWAEVRSLTKG